MSLIKIPKILEINNLINEPLYQNNLDFSQFDTKYKILAIYYPQNYINKMSYDENENMNENKEINLSKSLIEQQIELAKIHGIFGFGIVYNLANNIKFNEEIFNIISKDNSNNFSFFIILNNNIDINQQNQTSLIEYEAYREKSLNIFIDCFGTYSISKNYIKFKEKPILGIFHSSLSFELINYIRNHERKNNSYSIHIISIFNGNKESKYLNLTNSFVEFPSQNIGLEKNLTQEYFYNFYYYNLIKDGNAQSENIRNFFIINGSRPEKFFIIFREYLNLNKQTNNEFLLFNAWNNYKENSYLEPNKKFGFAYLNYLSKAIFNLENYEKFNLETLNNNCKIAIQVHIFYQDLIKEIINKTNNIPVKFDLYITITSKELYNDLQNYIKQFSKANYFEILIVENRGRDIFPFLEQFKHKFRFYKYLCHIHTKKSLTAPEIGVLWRNYLFQNLLGNEKIISEILFDFEKNKKLGFIFPETFFGIIKHFYILTNETKKWISFLFSELFPNYEIGNLVNFPAGNMFWAKIKAIYQIFIHDFSEYIPKEDDQTNDTILHGIERIWLYLVKFNKFRYKTVFKFF